GANPFVVQETLQEMMSHNVGIIRVKHELETAVEKLQELKKEAATAKAHATSQYNAGWHTALDLRNLLISSEAVARAALMREESRGAHTRDDFPGRSEERRVGKERRSRWSPEHEKRSAARRER